MTGKIGIENKKHERFHYLLNKVNGLANQAIAYMLCLLITFQPLVLQAAEIKAAQNVAAANQASIETTANNIPLVNIVAPNASGLSHNKYDQFNVGQSGAILNNSNQNLERSQLGGLVQGNPNLSGSTASVILNEVVSANPSILQGMLEVHGNNADVIIANPNGVTCNGCGFINTPRAVLSTGTPQFNLDGALQNLLVEKGDINIGLRGANLDSVNAFELVSRKISIDGPINVLGDLNLVAGQNSYAYQSGLIAPLQLDSQPDGSQPIAIDSTLLGGMYAGRIKIVSTDRGAGVNAQGQMAANAHGMTITADGKLVLGDAVSKSTIQATSSSESVQVERTLFSDEAIMLAGNSAINLDDNALVASLGDISLKADSVSLGNSSLVATGTSQDGTQTNNGTLGVEADEVSIRGGQLAAGKILNITAFAINLDPTVSDSMDVLRSLGDISLNAAEISAQNANVTAAGALALKSSSSLNLTKGIYSAADDLFIEADNVKTNANLNSQKQITINSAAEDVANSGQISAHGAITIKAAQTLENEGALLSSQTINLAAGESVNNTQAGQIIGNDGVLLNASSLENAGDILAQDSELTANIKGSLNNDGAFAGARAFLNIDGVLNNKATIQITNDLTIKGHVNPYAAALNNAAQGLITSGSGAYFLSSFDNAGSLNSNAGTLEIEATGNLANSGTIEAKQAGSIELDGNLNNSGSIISAQALAITGRFDGALGALSNSHNTALINGTENVTIKATSVVNAGEIGSAKGDLRAEISGDLSNMGIFYAGTSASYRLDGDLSNVNADIIAEDDLTVAGLAESRAASIKNASANIEAISGNLSLTADQISNERTQLAFGSTASTTKSSSGSTTTTTVTTRETLDETSAPSKLLAGKNITIDANVLNNNYSQIAANGDISIAGNNLNNMGRDLIETVDKTSETQHSQRYCSKKIFGACISRKTRYWKTYSYSTTSSTYDSAFAVIEAAGTLNANVSGYLANDAVRANASQIGLASGSRALSAADVAAQTDAGNAVTFDVLNVSIDGLLGRRALFDVAQEPDAPFLIETRSKFIDPSEFLGSEFFLSKIGGYDADQNIRRIGDAYLETQLIFDQVFELTGQRYVGNSTNTRDLVQSLYENAIDAQQGLDLTFGVSLSASQVARLTQDITWLETRIVNGESVLVPRVYLASSTLDHVDIAGAKIKANYTDIQSATLLNSGAIASNDDLKITTEESLINQGGAISSNAAITLDGGELFANSSGSVSGDDVTITAGNILNDTLKIRDQRSNGFTDRNHQNARIEADGNLVLQATGAIASTGGQFSADEAITLEAGGNIDIAALEIERLAHDHIDGGYNRESSLTNQLSGIDAGNEITIHSGGDVTLKGTKTVSGQDTNITATGDVNIIAVQDYQSKDLKLDINSGGLFGASTNIRSQSSASQTQGSDVDAGGALNVTSNQQDIRVQASSLASEAETTLSAQQGQVALLSTTDSQFERDQFREEGLLWWNESDKGQITETINHVKIDAAGGLTINAGEGIIVEYQKTGNLNASVEQLMKSPGLEWMGQLKDDPRVDWAGVEAQFDSWDYETQGLTEAGAALVSIAVAAVTGGALSALSANLATGIGLAGNSIAQASIQAGLSSLTSQISLTLINTQGDIGATLQSLGSSDSLRSLATAMVAAGLTAHISDVAGIGKDLPKAAPLADRVAQDIQRGLIRATVNTGVSTAIEGGKLDENLISALRMEAASVIGENAAQEIGMAVDAGNLNKASQLIAHAALGCVVGASATGDCTSGAAGGVVGETVGWITKDVLTNWLEKRVSDIHSGEVSGAELLQEFNEYKDIGIDVARLASGFAVAAAGGDADIAAQAGGNAAENNALCGGLCIGAVAIVIAAYTTYVGDGNPLEGLAVIGTGDHPLAHALAAGTGAAVQWSAEQYPEQTAAVFSVLEATGNAIDATVTYIDDATGNEISNHWNDIPEHTRNQIQGGVKIASIFLPGASVKTLKQLKTSTGMPDIKTANVTANGTANAATGVKLKQELLSDEIVNHAFYKHVLQQGEFKGLDIRTTAQLKDHIKNVIDNPSSIRYYGNGRTAYIHESTHTVVFHNASSGPSTAFRPENWTEFISQLPKKTTAPK